MKKALFLLTALLTVSSTACFAGCSDGQSGKNTSTNVHEEQRIVAIDDAKDTDNKDCPNGECPDKTLPEHRGRHGAPKGGRYGKKLPTNTASDEDEKAIKRPEKLEHFVLRFDVIVIPHAPKRPAPRPDETPEQTPEEGTDDVQTEENN